ncbi:MAG: hypothetical protein IRZ22_12350, partial [Alicyclobacillaceae bacterium]|nr:hypothetical protein [Alicyclobacillaceae bacterium]
MTASNVLHPRDRPRWASLAADAATRPIRAWRRWGPWALIQAAALAAWQWQG